MGIDMMAIRRQNEVLLAKHGFSFAKWLPVRGEDELSVRPASEIAARLSALQAVVLLVCAPETFATERDVVKMVRECKLDEWCTEDDRRILGMTRSEAAETERGNIGWRQENMVSLAWALSHAVELGDGIWLPKGDALRSTLLFAPAKGEACKALISSAAARPDQELFASEDLFYCLHNAVRSAALGGGDTVPEDFNIAFQGGIVHERRHALTWVLSPGTDWEATDLST
jgi:hypothetical protein